MTTPFALLVTLAGLSDTEAAEFLGVDLVTVLAWSTVRTQAPEQKAIDRLRQLIGEQERVAREAVAEIERSAGRVGEHSKSEIFIEVPADDEAAHALGWPALSA